VKNALGPWLLPPLAVRQGDGGITGQEERSLVGYHNVKATMSEKNIMVGRAWSGCGFSGDSR
jgi:hypothetical protein